MRAQTKDLCKRNIHAAYLSDMQEEDSTTSNLLEEQQTFNYGDLRTGNFNILFESPESLLHPVTKTLLKEISAQV